MNLSRRCSQGWSRLLVCESNERRNRGFLLIIVAMVWLLCAGLEYSQAGAVEREAPLNSQAHSLLADELGAGISGTVLDEQGDVVPWARVTLLGPEGQKTVTTNRVGKFTLKDLKPGGPYRLTVECSGCVPWTSDAITLQPGHLLTGYDVHLRASGGIVSAGMAPKTELLIATAQMHEEEQQRVLDVFPNFYVTYNPQTVPLSAGMKYKLALRNALDPMTFVGAAFLAAIYQAGGTPDYGGGVEGYGKRVGDEYASDFADVMVGGAVLPALLHQDPRYFYKGTGTKRARLMYAIRSAFLCRGDNGKTQMNYSGIGGDLAAGALPNLYLPDEDRGVGTTFEGFGIFTASRITVNVLQEFFLNRMTSRGHHKRH